MFRRRSRSLRRKPSLATPWRWQPVVESLEDRTLLSFSSIAPISYPYYNSPAEFSGAQQAVAVGDLRGNSLNDLVTTEGAIGGTDPTRMVVNVYLNNGDGTFQAPVHYAAGPGPDGLALGDFNQDGHLDLVVTDAGAGAVGHTVSVLLGNGDGTFQSPRTFLVGRDPTAVAVGSFAGDGNLDIVTGNGDGTLSVLLGNGDGTFQPTVDYDVGSFSGSVAVGDLRGNGTSDLVAGGNGTVSVLLGNGDGTFQRAVHYSTGDSDGLGSLALGDFNGDGNLDVVTANGLFTHSFSILLGNGDGTFQAAVTHTTNLEVGGLRVATADFRGTGRSDLILLNSGLLRPDGTQVPDTLSVFLNNGDGTFADPLTTGAGVLPFSMAVADLRGDGQLDIAVVNGGEFGDVSVLFGNGDGTFQAAPTYDTGHVPVAVAKGDLRRNGLQDLVTANQQDNTVSVLLANGDGTFQPAVTYAAGSRPQDVAVADLTGNGIQDLVVLGSFRDTQTHGTITVLLGNGDGTFQAPQTFLVKPMGPGESEFPAHLAVGDLTGRGIPDLAVTDEDIAAGHDDTGVSVLEGNGDGTFQFLTRAPVDLGLLNPDHVVIGDFDKDGQNDIAFTTVLGVFVVFGPNFTRARNIGPGAFAIAAADLTGSGSLDLLATTHLENNAANDNEVMIYRGNGDGTFTRATPLFTGQLTADVAVGDITGDGVLSIVTADDTGNSVSVFAGNGDGTFQAPVRYLVGTGVSSVVLGDFNGDGLGDIAAVNNFSNNVSVLLNTSGTASAARAAHPARSTGVARVAGATPVNLRQEALPGGQAAPEGMGHGLAQPGGAPSAQAGAQAPDLAARDAVFATPSAGDLGVFTRPRPVIPAGAGWADADRWEELPLDQAFAV